MVRGPDDLAEVVREAGVADPRIIDAVRRIPRAGFVPAEHLSEAYLDLPVVIPRRQVTTQPSLSAAMIEALELGGDETVLEVGTGYGYQTALLASLVRWVWSVERFPDLADSARVNLARHAVTNVTVVVGDGSLGLAEQAPFEAILVSAAFDRVPDPLAGQLSPGGRLVQPVGPGGSELVKLFRKDPDGALVEVRTVTAARFVRLFGEHGFPAP